MSSKQDDSNANPEQIESQEQQSQEQEMGIDPEQLEMLLGSMDEEQRQNFLKQMEEQGYAEYQDENGET